MSARALVADSRFGTGGARVVNFKSRAWSDRELDTLKRLIEDGASYSQVAKELGRSRSAIAGAVMRMRARDAVDDQVADLLAADMSPARIALKLGLTRLAVSFSMARIRASLGEQAA